MRLKACAFLQRRLKACAFYNDAYLFAPLYNDAFLRMRLFIAEPLMVVTQMISQDN